MGFKKLTLKETFERIMNPSKYILENIEPLDPDDQDVKDMNIGNFPTTVLTENLKKIKDPTRDCSGVSKLNEDNSAVEASEPYEKSEPLILNTTFPNMQYKFVKVEPNKVNFSMIVSGKELGKGAVYDLEKLKDKSFYGELSKWMNNEGMDSDMNEAVINEDGFDKDGNAYGFDRSESDVSKFEVGDLVFDKSVGQSGLVALVTSVEGGNTELYYRGYNGDRETLSSDELDDIVDAYPKFIDILVNKGDISAYASICKELGITLNPKYERAALQYENDVESYYDDSDMNEAIDFNDDGEGKYRRLSMDSESDWESEDVNDYIPSKGDSIYLETGYPNVKSRITYIDPTHIFWKTGTDSDLSTGGNGSAYHIGQLRDKEFYNDLIKWMHEGDPEALRSKKYSDI